MITAQQNPSSRRALLRHLGGLRTVLLVLLSGMALPIANAQTSCTVGYAITNQFPGGFGASLTIGNTGTTAISNWTLTWSFANGQTISQLWDGNETQNGANVMVTNASFDGNIPAGGSLTGVGFNGTWNNSVNAPPTAFALNGVPCNGASSSGGSSGSFTLSPSASALSVAIGASATDTILVTDSQGFSGNVTLTASGLPGGVTATFAGGALTLTASATAVPGTSTVTITGTSGSATATTSVVLTISPSVSTSSLQVAWVSPATGVSGSSMTIMPGVGTSFGGSQGTSAVFFGTTRAMVTTWAINSVTVTVPSLPAGPVNVTAVVNGVTSNAVPFTVTSATPSPVVFTGNSTWFTALGSPFGGCGVPQGNLDSQNFIALNVQNDPGNYSLELSRPISSAFANDIGLWNNGLNCGRWVHAVIGANCQGTNDGAQNEPFCRGGEGWVADQFTGASLDLVVADSCQDSNAWCRDDPYHIDQAQAALNKYVLNGNPIGNMFPNFWNNRQVTWNFELAPNYTGDINIAFIMGANAFWSAISITHLLNGIHGVDYMLNGVWTAAVMDADLGDDYVVLPTVSGGTQYQIRVHDVTGQLINGGRIYSFSFPVSCGTQCTPAFSPITYTTSAPAGIAAQ
jgi:Cellulose binding domain